MCGTTTPRFFQVWTLAASLWMLAMALGDWGLHGVSWLLDTRMEEVARAACEQHAGTLFADEEGGSHCLRCSSPRIVASWP